MKYLLNKFCDIPAENKPRERLIAHGADTLSDIELLAIIINSGIRDIPVTEVAKKLLINSGGLDKIFNLDLNQLKKEKGIGIAKAVNLKAIQEIAKRIHIPSNQLKIEIKTPQDAFNYIKKDLYGKKKEYVFLLSLDSRRKIISKDLICIGSVNETLVPQREILKTALEKDAVNIIIVHNHPSNDPTPSKEDLLITQKIHSACTCIGITFLDHIITANDHYTSVKNFNESPKIVKGGENR